MNLRYCHSSIHAMFYAEVVVVRIDMVCVLISYFSSCIPVSIIHRILFQNVWNSMHRMQKKSILHCKHWICSKSVLFAIAERGFCWGTRSRRGRAAGWSAPCPPLPVLPVISCPFQPVLLDAPPQLLPSLDPLSPPDSLRARDCLFDTDKNLQREWTGAGLMACIPRCLYSPRDLSARPSDWWPSAAACAFCHAAHMQAGQPEHGCVFASGPYGAPAVSSSAAPAPPAAVRTLPAGLSRQLASPATPHSANRPLTAPWRPDSEIPTNANSDHSKKRQKTLTETLTYTNYQLSTTITITITIIVKIKITNKNWKANKET